MQKKTSNLTKFAITSIAIAFITAGFSELVAKEKNTIVEVATCVTSNVEADPKASDNYCKIICQDNHKKSGKSAECIGDEKLLCHNSFDNLKQGYCFKCDCY